ncbi:MAG: WYL domain-containing protein [Clostridia bacterium]|nr:WYL domain-containing protein [Clostridia bacterium]
MTNENIKRIRLLRLWEILNQESDEDHPIGTEELRAKLATSGIQCDRKTLYSDVALLNNFGYEIFCLRSTSNQYYVEDRSFSVPEVLIIMDAVQAASFITERKTEELVDKVGKLAGSQRGEVLKQNVVQFSTVKSMNESIYYSVSEISNAIVSKKKIGFNYFDYDLRFNRAYRMDKDNPEVRKYYVVNPMATVFSNDNYYLFCYDDKHGTVVQYRVDRMDKVRMLDDDITPSKEAESFDLAEHKRQLFGMYGGEECAVELEAERELIDVICDKFGKTVSLQETTDGKIAFTANVQVSPTFMAWCCSFGNLLKVKGPSHVVDRIKDYLDSVRAIY